MDFVSVLERRLNGWNMIVKVPAVDDEGKPFADKPGIEKFTEVLKQCGRIPTHELILEVGQALKIPWLDLADLGDNDGYITGDAANNLREYFKCPLAPAQVRFLQSQSGEAGGSNNKPLYEPGESFKDPQN